MPLYIFLHCCIMYGRINFFDESWHLEGGVLEYPGDHSGPPEEIISCRCVEVLDPDSHPAL